MTTFDQMRTLVARRFHVHRSALREDTILSALPSGDSEHPRIALLIDLEQHFGIRLLDHSIADCVSLGELAEAIENRRATSPLQAAE
jgi:acyl carrier protein